MFTQGKQSLPCASSISRHSANDVGLHFSVTNCQGKVLSRLSWRRDNAKLVQQIQVVTIEPWFDSLAVYDTVNEHPRPAHLFACGSDASERALVGTTRRIANHDGVSFCDHILNGKLQVRKGGEEHREELFVGF